jgi:type I restriction enzyme S subunit
MKFSIVNYNLILSNKTHRMEAEFYNAKSTMIDNYYSGEDIIDFIQYGTSEELNEESKGYPILRLNEYDGLFIKKPEKYCDKIDHDNYKSLVLKKDDVLICRTNGNPKLVGKCALVPEDCDFAFASYLFRVRPKKLLILPSVLSIYLNSKNGRYEIEKNLMVSNQANFSPAKFREILIPKLDQTLQEKINTIVSAAFQKHKGANLFYYQAEQILFSELGLLRWKPKHNLSFTKCFSDTESSKRIDAEYFQPMYEEIIERIKKYKNGYKPLGERVKTKDKNFMPKNDITYRYIELANISSNGNINGFIESMGKELPTRARRIVSAGDVIVSTIEGSLSRIALITEDLDKALCSTGFFVINSENINSETLLVFLKSFAGQLQLKKGCSGTILTAIGDDEFKRIILPDLPVGIQNDIKKKITEMYKAKALSKRLLDISKRSVEMAIEKDEQTAIKWLEKQVDGVN